MRIISPTLIIHDGLTATEATTKQQLDTKISYASLADDGATLVEFRQIGSDSAPRSLYDKLQVSLSASDFGAIGDLVYEPITEDTVMKITGTDSSIFIQEALDKAGEMAALASTPSNVSYVRVIIERGQYLLQSPITIPPLVELDCQGLLFNFMSDPSIPLITGKAKSLCTQVYVHANGKSGIKWGELNTKNDCDLGKIVVSHVGSARNGLLLQGENFISRSIWIDGGLNGIALDRVREFAGIQASVTRSINGIRVFKSELVAMVGVTLKNCRQNGVLMDESQHVFLRLDATVDSDHTGTPMSTGILIGSNSITPSSFLDISYRAQSTGGWGLSLDYVVDSKIDLQLSNSRSGRQTDGVSLGSYASSHFSPNSNGSLLAHNIGVLYNPNGTSTNVAAIRYGNNISGYLSINLLKTSGIASSVGVTYGKLSIVDPELLQLSNVSIEGVLPGQFVRADASGKLVGADLFGGGSVRTTFYNMVISQDTPVNSLLIPHRWDLYPQVDALDGATNRILDSANYDVYYESLDSVRLVFPQPFVGKIILNGGADVRLSSGVQITRNGIYIQETLASTWDVTHNWDTFPCVTLIEPTTKKKLPVHVQYLDSHSLRITVQTPVAGIVSLNTSAKISPSALPGVVSPEEGTNEIFPQVAPSDLWIINHNWGVYPSVFVLDPQTKIRVYPEVSYPNENQVRIAFSHPFAGFAVLNSGISGQLGTPQAGALSLDDGYFLRYEKTSRSRWEMLRVQIQERRHRRDGK